MQWQRGCGSRSYQERHPTPYTAELTKQQPGFSRGSHGGVQKGRRAESRRQPRRGSCLAMALKKSELYSSLWSSCDELRGGMDASQYKDYVLVLLFIKYVSDKYAGLPFAAITIPPGASFKDMVALKGKPDIGDQINKRIIAPLANANKLSDFPDFNDDNK